MLKSLTPAAFTALIRVNQNDIHEALGVPRGHWSRTVLDPVFWPAAYGFATLIDRFDAEVGARGLAGGAAWLMRHVTRGLEVAGEYHIPTTGPVLILSNHPGMADTLALFASLARRAEASRRDVRVIALVRPFLRSLPNISEHLIYVPSAEAERLTVVRQAAAHLRQGGLALTFPAGEIEPDPAVAGEAEAARALAQWSPSMAVLARLAPQTIIIPTLVSNVLSAAAQNHPLTHLRRAPADRARLGAMLQVMLPSYQGVVVRVAFGPPLRAAEVLAAHPDPAAFTRAITEAMQGLLTNPPTVWERVVEGAR